LFCRKFAPRTRFNLHPNVNSSFQPFSLNLRGRLITFEKPVVMGILNVTSDSFYAGSRIDPERIVERAGHMLDQGATFLDIGGQSTRPGAPDIGEEEELRRVIPAIEAVHRAFPDACISVDTWRGNVAAAAVDAGACMINDISAGSMDAAMWPVVSELQVPYVLMHMQGTPETMQVNPHYSDAVAEIMCWFSEKLAALRETFAGDVIIDPGFGFGKRQQDNYALLHALDEFRIWGSPVLAGLSRKKMIQNVCQVNADEALAGTIAANTIALMHGASILRVHNVKEAVDAVAVFMETRKAARSRF
jgi:dihydropteroate synthase